MMEFLRAALMAGIAQDQAYDVTLEWKAKEGHKSEIIQDQFFQMKVLVRSGDETLNRQEQSQKVDFQVVQEVLKTKKDKRAEARWIFRKAGRLVEGKRLPFGFEGKAVIARRGEDGSDAFGYEGGGELAAEDLTGIEEFLEVTKTRSKDKPALKDILGPGKPVRVGESWQPDKTLVLKGLNLKDFDVDLARSEARFKLISVETRQGARFGKIEGVFDFKIAKIGQLALDKLMTLRLTFHVDACLDGTAPDKKLTFRVEMKGTSAVTPPGAEKAVMLDLDFGGEWTGVMTSLP